ncbi:MAG: hypothetical protein R6W90_06275 [Ignavibacteriaceae bacterium]
MIKRFLLSITLFVTVNSLILPQVNTEYFLEGATISTIAGEGDDLWVATYGHGIFHYSREKEEWTNFSTKAGNLENDLFYNLAVSKDYVWAGSSDGLFTYDRKRNQWRKRKFAQGGEFGNWIRSLCYDPDENTLWVGRFRNLTRFDVARNRFIDIDRTQSKDPKSNNFISIKMDGDSVIWFGTESGAHKYNKKKEGDGAWQYINNKRNAFNNEGEAVSISDFLFEGRNIWFGTDEFVTSQKPQFNMGGIYRFNRQLNWKRFSKKDGLAANGIYCMEKTGNIIWAGLYSFDRKDKKEYGKGLVLIDRISGNVEQIDLNELDIKTSTVLSLYFDGSDMWLGTDEGLYKITIVNPLAQWTATKEATKKSGKKRG